jgi:AcrR family transcriptional regulator
MPRQATDTKRRIIDAAYELFYKGGFARASVDDIAEAAGVTKRTLYYHFDSKNTLVGAVLDAQHELVLSRIERWAEHASGNTSAMLDGLFAEFANWARQPGWRGSGFTRAAMELAHLPGHPGRIAARRHKTLVESWFADQFSRNGVADARGLARQIMLLIEGCHTLILIHRDPSYADAAAQAAQRLVRSHRSTASPKRARVAAPLL